ncbi:4Fe-4S binding protein [Methylocapsa polymorpha]|uniref:4Fe-4S binding protein n=1 Tax=Methylocapsa polymorpha TaxID=3080828 RepID=A0ABZ0HWS2_9HYPH|nr:4Fe-4S binding protein [Methylocapsa sp. RX1]
MTAFLVADPEKGFAERLPEVSPPDSEPTQRALLARGFYNFGEWLRRRQSLIQRVQWAIVLIYIALVATPAFLPLPGRMAHIWDNLTLFAQFAFWGLWWPFVLLSMILVGRAWCGLFCPEGALSETTSRFGRGYAVPRWITWKGWPFVAFVCTTIYGQMVSVYQYPKPALLILGGSTAGAIVVGYLYGRNKRVWCRYLCPVNGVFGLLAKLAPVHFSVDQDAWTASRLSGHAHAPPINCAPLVPIRTMRGASDCHMCGRCSSFRGAISLAPRSPDHEIVHVAGSTPKPAETLLIVFGLLGVAAGAFHWSVSPWYVAIKQAIAEQLIDMGIVWPMQLQPPWWILTDYPEVNDQLTLLDGAVLLAYIVATAAVIGTAVSICLWAAARSLGPWSSTRFHHLAQSLIPIAACGVFLGLSATTVTMLRAEGLPIGFVGLLRGALLAGAALWSVWLGWRIAGLSTLTSIRRSAATACVAAAASIGVGSWVLFFWIW